MRNSHRRTFFGNVFVIAMLMVPMTGILCGWHNAGHERIAVVSVQSCEGTLPEFFVQGISQVAHCAIDPDIFKEKQNDVALKRAEYPDHFFDLEYFSADELPLDRYAFAKWCFENDLEPGKIGTLPWSLTEYTQKLAMAFAEYRKWPENKNIQAKCLVYAGILAHYSGDAGMPLHSTKHYDGIEKPGSKSKEKKGIHLKVDALLEKIPSEKLPEAHQIEALTIEGKVLPAAYEFIRGSNKLVDRTYELYDKIPELSEIEIKSEEVLTFALLMLNRTAGFTAGLYQYAWQSSKEIELPEWHKRQY